MLQVMSRTCLMILMSDNGSLSDSATPKPKTVWSLGSYGDLALFIIPFLLTLFGYAVSLPMIMCWMWHAAMATQL